MREGVPFRVSAANGYGLCLEANKGVLRGWQPELTAPTKGKPKRNETSSRPGADVNLPHALSRLVVASAPTGTRRSKARPRS